MQQPYRMPGILPSLLVAGLLIACEREPPAQRVGHPLSNANLEALQEAEAAKYGVEQRLLEQASVDALLGRAQPPAR